MLIVIKWYWIIILFKYQNIVNQDKGAKMGENYSKFKVWGHRHEVHTTCVWQLNPYNLFSTRFDVVARRSMEDLLRWQIWRDRLLEDKFIGGCGKGGDGVNRWWWLVGPSSMGDAIFVGCDSAMVVEGSFNLKVKRLILP